ncbi:proteoglycan 4 isoform X1 [Lithobates pipiens]
MDISSTLLTSTPAATFNEESTKPAHNYDSTIEQQDMETKAKSTQDSFNNPVNMDMTTPYPGKNNGEKVEIDIGNTVSSETNSKVTTVTISPSHFDTNEKLNKETITYSSTTKETTEQPTASTDQIMLPTSHQSNVVFSESILKTTKNAYLNVASSATGSTEKAYSLHDEADNVNTIFPAGTAKEENINESKTTALLHSVDTTSARATQLAQTSIIMATDTNSKDSYNTSFTTEAKALSVTTKSPQINQAVSTLHSTQAPLKDSTNTARSMDTTEKENIPQSTTVAEVTTIKEEHLPTTDDNTNNVGILTTTFTNLLYSTSPGEDKSVSNIYTIEQTSAKMDTMYATLTEKQHSTHITLTEQTTTLSTPSLQPTKEQITQQPPDTTLIKEISSKPFKTVASTEKTEIPHTVTTSSAQKSSSASETSTLRQMPDTLHLTTDMTTNTEHSDISSVTTEDKLKVWQTTDNTDKVYPASTIQENLATLKEITESKHDNSVSSISVQNTRETTEGTDKVQSPTTAEGKLLSEIPSYATERNNQNIVTLIGKTSADTPTEVNSVMVATEKASNNADYVAVPGKTVNELLPNSTSSATPIESTTDKLQTTLQPKVEMTKMSPVNEVTDVKETTTTFSQATLYTTLSVDHETDLSTGESNDVTNAISTAEIIKEQTDPAKSNGITTQQSDEKKGTVSYTTMYRLDLQTSQIQSTNLPLTPDSETGVKPVTAEMSTITSLTTDVSQKSVLTKETSTSRQTVNLPEASQMPTTYHSGVSSTTAIEILKARHTTENINADQFPSTIQGKLLTSKEVTEREIMNTVTPTAKISTEVPAEKEVTEHEIYNTVTPTAKMATEVPVEKEKVTENEIYNTVVPTAKMSTEVPVEKEVTESEIYNTVMPTTKMSTEVPVEKEVTENEIYNTVMPTTKMSTGVPVEKEKVTENEIYNTVMPTTKMSTGVPVEKEKVTENDIYNTVMPTTKMSTEVPVEKEVTENEIYNKVTPTTKMSTEVLLEKEDVTENEIYNKVTPTTKMSTEAPIEKDEVTENEIYNNVTPTTKMSTEVPVEKEEVTENEIYNKVTPTTKMSTEVPVEISTIFVAKETATHNIDSIAVTKETSVSTLKTPQDQSTADSNAKHTTPRLEGTALTTSGLEGTAVTTPGLEGTAVTTPGLEGTAVTTPGTAVQHKSTPMGPTKHTPESGLTTTLSHSSPGKDSGTSPKTQTIDRSTKKINEYSTTSALFSTKNPNESQSQTSTNPTTRHADDIITKDSAETTTGQSVKLTTRQPGMDQTTKQPGQRPIPGGGSSYEATTKQSPNAKTTSIPRHTTTTPNHKDSFTTMPINEDDIENNKATTPHTIHPHHICNLLKDEAIRLRLPESDLKLITDTCAEMQQKYPNVNIPSSLQTRQPNIDEKKIPPEYPLSEGTPNIYQQPGSKIIQIIEEIYRRINTSPTTNLTGIPGQDNHRSTAWLLLINKIKRATDPQMNLCIGPPADGMTTLQNGSMVVFRGHYFWTLNQGGVTEMPRKISEVWGIPSPIDTVFTRCNCGGKTFFFKGPRYWRFTNDVMDKGYPKEIIKGFGGLGGKVTAVLSVAGIKTRPESVYFFKPGGNVQKYTFRQEQTKRCTKKKQPSVNYPIYSQKVQTVKFRFPRDIVRHRIEIRRTFTNIPQPLGILHEERSIRSTWRGIPNNIVSAVSLPNPQKQDGFDYFVFTKDKYYNINMSSKVAIKPPAEAEQKTTKDFYKCKE